MPRRRRRSNRAESGRPGTGALALAVISTYPRQSVATLMAVSAASVIIVNALWLQPGRHPAPIFAPRAVAVTVAPPPVAAPAPVSIAAPAAVPLPTPSPRRDPIAELLAPPAAKRLVAVQRALSDFGYGPVRPTGTMGADTQAAIERFERDRRLPVTGQVSERLLRELALMTGRPID